MRTKRVFFYTMPQFAFLPTFGIVWRYKGQTHNFYNYGLNFMWFNFLIVILFGKKR